jgi:hypothetical protein
MNKSKQPMAARARKKMKKELRAAAGLPDSVLQADRNTPQALLSRLPAKDRKKEEASLKSLQRNLESKRAKQKAPHSKRTNTGLIDVKSPPQIVHMEGRRWIKTLGKQTQAKRKVMTRQTTKKGSK